LALKVIGVTFIGVGNVIVKQDTHGWGVQVVILPASLRPEKGGQKYQRKQNATAN
jgi:hypothetical protein